MAHSARLHQVYVARQALARLWEHSQQSQDQLLARLQAWCVDAERSDQRCLQRFARQLASYG